MSACERANVQNDGLSIPAAPESSSSGRNERGSAILIQNYRVLVCDLDTEEQAEDKNNDQDTKKDRPKK
jgi:hypothetical protein